MSTSRYHQGYRFDKDVFFSYPKANRQYNEDRYWERYHTLVDRWSMVVLFMINSIGIPLAHNDFRSVALWEICVVVLAGVIGCIVMYAAVWFLFEAICGLIAFFNYAYCWLMAKD